VTIDDLARRLGAAAEELQAVGGELGRGEPVFDPLGKGAQEVAAMVVGAWSAQRDLAARLAAEAGELAASVAEAAANYRAADSGAADSGAAARFGEPL
jgi:Excreted virulence factor EspC, type VII ESX diderm